jgi:hypothetical protein
MPSLTPSDPLAEYDPVVDRDVAGYELVDELYLLVIEDPFEESFGHNLVLLYSHEKISLLPSYRCLTSDGASCLFLSWSRTRSSYSSESFGATRQKVWERYVETERRGCGGYILF